MELTYILQLDKSYQICFNGFSQKAFSETDAQLNNQSLCNSSLGCFTTFRHFKCEIPTKLTKHVMLAIEAGNVKFIPHTCFSMPHRLCQNTTLLLEAKQVSDSFHFSDTCATCHNVLQVSFAFEAERISLLCAFIAIIAVVRILFSSQVEIA